MYPVFALVIAAWLAYAVDSVASQNRALETLYQSRSRYMQTVGLAEAVDQYTVEKTSYPPSVDALTGTAGFEYARNLTNTWQGYGLSPTLADANWEYQRAVVILNDPSKGVDVATYLATNMCGTGAYDSAASWCGQAIGKWYRSENRERYAQQIATQRGRLMRLHKKLGNYYSANAKFPDLDAANASLAADSTNSLAALVSFGGTASTCSGTAHYLGVPIDCDDMYDLWGGAIGYQFVTSKHVLLIAETPIFDNAGNRIVVAADFDNSLL